MTPDPRPDEPGRASRWKRLDALYQEASARPAADRLADQRAELADGEGGLVVEGQRERVHAGGA